MEPAEPKDEKPTQGEMPASPVASDTPPAQSENPPTSQVADFSNIQSEEKKEEPAVETVQEVTIPVEKSHKKLFIIVAGVLIVGALFTGFFFFQKGSTSQEEKVPATAPEVSLTPAPPAGGPAPAIDRSEWTLEVLNGSGITGAAGKTAEKLTSLGYTVVKIGNADNNDYEETQLLVTKSMLPNGNLLLEDIKKIIHVATISGELKNSTASARLILGNE